ncbi:nuclear transport factor 2 family protein [Ruegeria faecimaris]|uniref:nuclear transport factor 2 family protein n=1 Tax=Ruegeria faecimaris TaxID=686389 RepID=UPI0024909400|nr:nuclear transport factor 2 family protein [Ruegeria faecimaris]
MNSKRELLQKLLKGIETGDAEAAAVVNEEKYIQHNPQTHEGSEGLATLFARLSKTNPKVKFVRVFEDGEFAFAHNEYDFAEVKAALEVFRFEDSKAVEHWDNIQPLRGPNASGRGMLDGPTEITDIDRTEQNRELVDNFSQTVLIDRKTERMKAFVDANLIQHDPDGVDGIDAYRMVLEARSDAELIVQYHRVHRVLAEGNFVLCMSEGASHGKHTSFYDLFRVADGVIVEQWGTMETIAPRSEWKNDNGKF